MDRWTHPATAQQTSPPLIPIPISLSIHLYLIPARDVDADGGWSDGNEVFFVLVSWYLHWSGLARLYSHTHPTSDPRRPPALAAPSLVPRFTPLLPAVVLVLHQHHLPVNSDLDTRSVILVSETAALALGANAALVLSTNIAVPAALRL